MKRLLLLALLFACSGTIHAQSKFVDPPILGYTKVSTEMAGMGQSSTGVAYYLVRHASAPRCYQKGQLYYDTVLDKARVCVATGSPGTWETSASGSVGTVTSVSGTANQISVANGTTTPTLSFPTGAVIAENFVSGFATQATAAGTTTLTVASKRKQAFTGSTTQTITLPVVSTLPQVGFSFDILNDSSGALTINSSGGNLVQTMAGGTRATFTAVLLTGTSAASWGVTYVGGFQPLDSDLTAIAGLTATSNNILQSSSSAWASRTPAQLVTTLALPYDVAVSFDGVPTASATIRFVTPRAFNSGASWVGTICSAGTAATAQTDFLVKVNTVTKVTLRFAASGTTCSLQSPTSVTFAAGDVIEIVAPGTPDATLANIAISIQGTLP